MARAVEVELPCVRIARTDGSNACVHPDVVAFRLPFVHVGGIEEVDVRHEDVDEARVGGDVAVAGGENQMRVMADGVLEEFADVLRGFRQ